MNIFKEWQRQRAAKERRQRHWEYLCSSSALEALVNLHLQLSLLDPQQENYESCAKKVFVEAFFVVRGDRKAQEFLCHFEDLFFEDLELKREEELGRSKE